MTDPTAVPPPTDKAGKFEDFIDIFFSPAKVFARRVGANPMLPWFVVSVLLVGMFYVNRGVMSGIMAGEIQRGMDAAAKANPQLSGDNAARAKGMIETTTSIAAVVGPPIALFVLALITWLVGKILGGTLTYGTALLITSFSWMPRVVESIIGSVQGILLDTSKMTSHFQIQLGPARFLDPATAPQWELGLLGRVDLITIWVTVLLAIGLVYAGKVPRSKMVLAGGLMWLIGSLPALYQALKG